MSRHFALVAGFVVLAAVPAAAQDLSRWVDVQTLNVGARYKAVEDADKSRTTHDLQDNVAVKARIKTDKAGRFTLNVGAFTGTSFTGSWNNTGWGSGQRVNTTSVKQLFAAVRVVKGVEAQVGSLYVARGEGTEITTYDNDAYVTGERLTVKRPAELFFDEVAFTNAYVGDFNSPSFFDRAGRFDDANYQQVLVAKKLGSRVATSLDWTTEADRTTWHGGVSARLPRVVNAVRFEYYVRPDDGVFGSSLMAERKVAKVVVSGGYADVDAAFGKLNGDRYGRGSRVFGGATVPVVGPLSASLFYTHGLSNSYRLSIAQRFDAVLTWNALPALQKAMR